MLNKLYLLCLITLICSCSQTENLTDASNPANNKVVAADGSSHTEFINRSAQTSCDTSEAMLVHAPWVKNGIQPPHILSVKQSDGSSTDFELGIDRSPDFLFSALADVIPGYYFYQGHSRLIAYSCARHTIQELDLAAAPGFEAQDAQSGMVKSLSTSESGTLKIELVDMGQVEFRITSEGLVRLR